ncbi:hypothetical protein CDAR_365091 [Caerostris darwini]|uniref:Uncharacterized protein n=1 Tax=Caerostris darwini TaxID=1538125 RepID=A0AAV4S4K8_9ARAC|nr:hypothetical protein CDAR_365091 [Caerostris darwini]
MVKQAGLTYAEKLLTAAVASWVLGRLATRRSRQTPGQHTTAKLQDYREVIDSYSLQLGGLFGAERNRLRPSPGKAEPAGCCSDLYPGPLHQGGRNLIRGRHPAGYLIYGIVLLGKNVSVCGCRSR